MEENEKKDESDWKFFFFSYQGLGKTLSVHGRVLAVFFFPGFCEEVGTAGWWDAASPYDPWQRGRGRALVEVE